MGLTFYVLSLLAVASLVRLAVSNSVRLNDDQRNALLTIATLPQDMRSAAQQVRAWVHGLPAWTLLPR